MKILFTSLLIAFTVLSIQAQVTAEYICTQFLAPSSGGVFRGLDFSMSNEDIQMVEGDRNNINLLTEGNVLEAPILNYRLNVSVTNYAKIDYKINNELLYGVTGKIYVTNEYAAQDVVNYLAAYYIEDLGAPITDSDGGLIFTGKLKDTDIILSISLMKDGTKNYVSYMLATS